MICYLCGDSIPAEDPFYNDYGKTVCKPCFSEAQRCFVCRFPGKAMQAVEGLGAECEFCRQPDAAIVREGGDVLASLEPLLAYLAKYGIQWPAAPQFRWSEMRALRDLQTQADLPREEFVDDFLRYCYPVFYHEGSLHCLKRMARSTFVVHATIQVAAGYYAGLLRLPNLLGNTPFHTFSRGWCHWLGFSAASLLGYETEQRQLRRWPELGAQGEFERWEAMAKFKKPAQMLSFYKANLKSLAKRHLTA